MSAITEKWLKLDSERLELENQIRDHQHRVRELRKEMDTEALSHRPSYPTAHQRAGLRAAVDEIRKMTVPESHHGDPCAPDIVDDNGFHRRYEVVVDGSRGWLNIRDRAPYSVARPGSHLWTFNDAEVEEILAVLKADGLIVRRHWLCDGGLSVEGTTR